MPALFKHQSVAEPRRRRRLRSPRATPPPLCHVPKLPKVPAKGQAPPAVKEPQEFRAGWRFYGRQMSHRSETCVTNHVPRQTAWCGGGNRGAEVLTSKGNAFRHNQPIISQAGKATLSPAPGF